jgi:hypothetical protein
MASLERIRDSMDVQPTPEDKGLALTLRLVVYDNGIFQLDGIPLNSHSHPHSQVVGWVGAAEVIARTISEFSRQVAQRQQQRQEQVAV